MDVKENFPSEKSEGRDTIVDALMREVNRMKLKTIAKTAVRGTTTAPDGVVLFSVRMSKKLRAIIEEKAAEEDRSANQMMVMLLCEALKVEYRDYK